MIVKASRLSSLSWRIEFDLYASSRRHNLIFRVCLDIQFYVQNVFLFFIQKRLLRLIDDRRQRRGISDVNLRRLDTEILVPIINWFVPG